VSTTRFAQEAAMALDSTASTHWEGDLFSGRGTTTLESGAAGPLEVTWKARAEEHGSTTSPEELIAAAHASCYCMALSNELAKGGTPPAGKARIASACSSATSATLFMNSWCSRCALLTTAIVGLAIAASSAVSPR